MNLKAVNWFGLLSGVLLIVLVIISLFVPWWQLTVGDNLMQVNVSPFATGFNLLGTVFTIPLIWALNLIMIIGFLASGIAMLIYAILPTRSFSKHLLGFAYKKPLIGVIIFAAVLFLATIFVMSFVQLYIPLSGSAISTLPASMTQGVTVSVAISSGFLWPFWLAIIIAVLCIIARIYHRRVAKI